MPQGSAVRGSDQDGEGRSRPDPGLSRLSTGSDIPSTLWVKNRPNLSLALNKSLPQPSFVHSLAALADPTRRRIVELLAERDLAAGEIAARFKLSAPAISQHLKVLRAAALVRVRADAQRRIYELDPDGLAALEQWLGHVRQSWRRRLTSPERRLIKRAREADAQR